jgi:hypothetical protein
MNLLAEGLLRPLKTDRTVRPPKDVQDEFHYFDLERENQEKDMRLFKESLRGRYPKKAPKIVGAEDIPGVGLIGKTERGLVLTSTQLGQLRDYEERNKLKGNPARRFGGYYVLENRIKK